MKKSNTKLTIAFLAIVACQLSTGNFLTTPAQAQTAADGFADNVQPHGGYTHVTPGAYIPRQQPQIRESTQSYHNTYQRFEPQRAVQQPNVRTQPEPLATPQQAQPAAAPETVTLDQAKTQDLSIPDDSNNSPARGSNNSASQAAARLRSAIYRPLGLIRRY